MHKRVVLFMSIILCSWFLLAKKIDSPFIAKKKMRGLSKSKLKEQSAQELGALLQSLPGLIKSIAHTQELAMQKLTQYLEGEKKCFWSDASCKQLLICKNNVESFNTRIEQIQAQLGEFITFLDALNVSHDAKKQVEKT